MLPGDQYPRPLKFFHGFIFPPIMWRGLFIGIDLSAVPLCPFRRAARCFFHKSFLSFNRRRNSFSESSPPSCFINFALCSFRRSIPIVSFSRPLFMTLSLIIFFCCSIASESFFRSLRSYGKASTYLFRGCKYRPCPKMVRDILSVGSPNACICFLTSENGMILSVRRIFPWLRGLFKCLRSIMHLRKIFLTRSDTSSGRYA
mmetsp:Transcript_29629/g.72190  ORF Transcript_29629/g.72190 Transcript_29629/m.72190 type:complete len:202 (+) Transcript_29629:201-806(+)